MTRRPHDREIDEAVLLIKEALLYLAPLEDDEAIEMLLQSVEYLTGEEVEYTDIRSRD